MESIKFLEDFQAGRQEKTAGYQYFVPNPINRQRKWKDAQLNTLLEKASRKIGELNSFARLVPNIDLFIQLHVMKEAVISSRIEGTKTNIDEALLTEEDIRPERRDDWREVNNYTKALNATINELQQIPLSTRLLCQAHYTILQGVRGKHKNPGEFRKSQNWIGGASLEDAVFIPPAHTYVNGLMGDLENFLHNDKIAVPSLIRIAIAHYQFETIHPFLDGNGRIGRLLITLYLVSEKMLSQPLLYLSTFFEKNKVLYYDKLQFVREKNEISSWLKYFLTGVYETADQAANTLSEMITLKENLESEICLDMGRRTQSALTLLQQLFKHPVVQVKNVEQICQLSTKAANDLVAAFTQKGYLAEFSGQRRYRIFRFDPYLKMFSE
jgi:Fic family protein